MTMLGFVDESGTDPSMRCYSIGCLIIPAHDIDTFNEHFRSKAILHGVGSELHWNRFSNGHGAVNLAIDLLIYILSNNCSYHVMVVNKVKFKKWNTKKRNKRYREDAYYETLTHLFRYCANALTDEYYMHCDERPDKYSRQREVTETIANHMLRRLGSPSRIVEVTSNNSKLVPAIQTSDVLTGAINAAHAEFLAGSSISLPPAKTLCMQGLARVLGWPNLCCDTHPDKKFNIWHFPLEWRAKPETRRITPAFEYPPYISSENMKSLSP